MKKSIYINSAILLLVFSFIITGSVFARYANQSLERDSQKLGFSSFSSEIVKSNYDLWWSGNDFNIWNTNLGNVGVGENNPQAKLHINFLHNNPLLITNGSNQIFEVNNLGIITLGKIYSESIIAGNLTGHFIFDNSISFNDAINANFGINVGGSNIILDPVNSAIEWGNGAYLKQNETHFVFGGGSKYFFDNKVGIGTNNPLANLHIRENNTNISFNDNSNLIIEGISARIDLISREFADSTINFRNIGGTASIMHTGPAWPQKPNHMIFESPNGFYFTNDLHVNGSIRGEHQASNGQSGLTKSYLLQDANGASCQMHFVNGLLVESNCLQTSFNPNPPLR